MRTLSLAGDAVHAGSLILVNGAYPYHEETALPYLVTVNSRDAGILLERKAAALLSKLMDEISGWTKIAAVSGWRSKQEQQEIFDNSIRDNGGDFTSNFVALPGHSEHQTGLAIDLGLRKERIDFIRPDFPYSGICQAFRERAGAFGFIERYPQGREKTTGIAHEPWHFRYAGVPHAAIMLEMGLTLEEYIGFVRQFKWGESSFAYTGCGREIAVSYREAENRNTVIEVDPDKPYSISGNNIDGFIVTEWRGRI